MKKFGATAVVLVDDEDYDLVIGYRWFVTDRGYIATNTESKTVKLHNLIMNPSEGLEVDHINGNKLDNRRENLRLVNRAQNCWNASKKYTAKRTSQYKGVHVDSYTGKWRAMITVNGENYRSRRLSSEGEAARWYDEMAVKHHGEYARLNFPLPQPITEGDEQAN